MKQRTVDAARGRWVSILSCLGVEESFLRNKHGPCPFCGGKDRYRFDDKDGNGTWFCSACGSGRGIEFVMRLYACDFRAACERIDPLTGTAKIQTTRRRDDPRPRLRRIWTESAPVTDGDAVSVYLASRGLTLPTSKDVRCHPRLPYWDEGKRVGDFAAMVSLMRLSSGEPVSLHITYLHDGAKAAVSSAKKIITPVGKMAGCAIRLAEPNSGILAIAEGIETALAFSLLKHIPCWAATNATFLAQFEPPEGVSTVIVAGDNDANYAGQHAAYSLANRLHMRGKEVCVLIPDAEGTDWADVAVEKARRTASAIDCVVVRLPNQQGLRNV